MPPFQCPICLDDLGSSPVDDNGRPSENDKIVAIPCGHVFHDTCIQKWKDSQPVGEFRCPTCREIFFRHQATNVLFMPQANNPSSNIYRKGQLKNKSVIDLRKIVLDLSSKLCDAERSSKEMSELTKSLERRNKIVTQENSNLKTSLAKSQAECERIQSQYESNYAKLRVCTLRNEQLTKDLETLRSHKGLKENDGAIQSCSGSGRKKPYDFPQTARMSTGGRRVTLKAKRSLGSRLPAIPLVRISTSPSTSNSSSASSSAGAGAGTVFGTASNRRGSATSSSWNNATTASFSAVPATSSRPVRMRADNSIQSNPVPPLRQRLSPLTSNPTVSTPVVRIIRISTGPENNPYSHLPREGGSRYNLRARSHPPGQR